MTRKASFAPIVDAQTRVLLLGSLPGEASLKAERYYAHPQNQFWKLVGGAIGVDLHGMDYDARLAALRAAHVGLWDVVADAVRAGSLDGAIKDHRGNDLTGLIATLPGLRAIGFNGGTAARIGRKLLAGAVHPPLIDLPSSSPAFTRPLQEKQAAWDTIRFWLSAAKI
ncbi:DNA-deoxyinosine glycosylase [Sphingomonas crocodyli]|uniref:DNA-deoxyinosine glycosylase n=1 Tax=Sphingomonas crocodyli TaxID=1979270 RepID=A0A437LVI0_9SPHN|nr:DNA-deoxyinosine glycosylase [Sphingomonas crocodyli]RVT89410.1 DNA-deoxyinosine glycosylase [Sphingomonas crocodyli]